VSLDITFLGQTSGQRTWVSLDRLPWTDYVWVSLDRGRGGRCQCMGVLGQLLWTAFLGQLVDRLGQRTDTAPGSLRQFINHRATPAAMAISTAPNLTNAALSPSRRSSTSFAVPS